VRQTQGNGIDVRELMLFGNCRHDGGFVGRRTRSDCSRNGLIHIYYVVCLLCEEMCGKLLGQTWKMVEHMCNAPDPNGDEISVLRILLVLVSASTPACRPS
jgi:hypothetical protein